MRLEVLGTVFGGETDLAHRSDGPGKIVSPVELEREGRGREPRRLGLGGRDVRCPILEEGRGDRHRRGEDRHVRQIRTPVVLAHDLLLELLIDFKRLFDRQVFDEEGEMKKGQ